MASLLLYIQLSPVILICITYLICRVEKIITFGYWLIDI